MIKVELTKNVFNQRGGGLFGLKPIQLVFAAVAVVIGGVTVLWLMQYGLSIDLIGWIVFIEMTIIIGLASGWEKPFFFPADIIKARYKILLSGGGRI